GGLAGSYAPAYSQPASSARRRATQACDACSCPLRGCPLAHTVTTERLERLSGEVMPAAPRKGRDNAAGCAVKRVRRIGVALAASRCVCGGVWGITFRAGAWHPALLGAVARRHPASRRRGATRI